MFIAYNRKISEDIRCGKTIKNLKISRVEIPCASFHCADTDVASVGRKHKSKRMESIADHGGLENPPTT